jgi:hypothetical protein
MKQFFMKPQKYKKLIQRYERAVKQAAGQIKSSGCFLKSLIR